MRTIEEIKGNRKYIYSGGLEIAKDGMRGYLNVDNVSMTCENKVSLSSDRKFA